LTFSHLVSYLAS